MNMSEDEKDAAVQIRNAIRRILGPDTGYVVLYVRDPVDGMKLISNTGSNDEVRFVLSTAIGLLDDSSASQIVKIKTQ